jgi:hypothetical protein
LKTVEGVVKGRREGRKEEGFVEVGVVLVLYNR